MKKSSKLQPRSDALANRNFNNVKQSARATGSQWSPPSDPGFEWQEVPAHWCTSSSCSESEGVHSHSSLASACTDSNQKINVTSEDRHFNESIEGKEEGSLGVTATNEVNLREDKERLAKSTHLALKSVVSKNSESRNFSMNKTCDSVEGVNEVHSEKLSYPQKLAKDGCRKKKTRDVPKMKWSDSSYDSELPSLLKEVKVRYGLQIEDLTEEEEIWMVQCPPSLNPQDLKNQDLVFGGTSAFPLEIEDVGSYETVSYVSGMKPVPCLLPSRETGSLQAKVLQPKGLMVIMEKVDVPEVKLIPTIPRNFETPKGLRVRHPLFGSDYKEELEVRTQIASEHREMLGEDLLMQPKRRKKKKKKGRRNNKHKTKKNKKKHHKKHKKKEKHKHVKNH